MLDSNLDDNFSMRYYLMSAIAERIRSKGLTQHEAAKILKISQSKVCLLINQKAENFKVDKLIEIAGRVDLQVDLDIKLTT
jgi:predicted XRE-type DNA-binding protein